MPQHISIPVDGTIELLNVTPLVDNPLLSHCEIKVCYLGENRNGSVISKNVAMEMSKTLHGCPIVGYYDKETDDFSGHNRSIEVGGGKFKVVDMTKPYGFVDSSAKIWFQKFLDDGVEHEYLMTEGYLWTSVYEEAKKVIEQGRNQSMELSEENLDGTWTFDDNGLPKFFIINEAMIQKLCILGEDVEPCFEGAGIAAQFSFDGNFKKELFSLMEDIKNALSKGGFTSMGDENKVVETIEEPVFEEKVEEPEVEETPAEEVIEEVSEPEVEEPAEEETVVEEVAPQEEVPVEQFALTDEQVLDSDLYKNLATEFAAMKEELEALKAEVEPLRKFKFEADRKAKQEMINSFYMLSDEDKKDCVNNIDTYSLEDIEAKLSIICVRNKVSFSLEDDKQDNPMIYTLDNNDDGDSAPAWVKAVRETAKEMN